MSDNGNQSGIRESLRASVRRLLCVALVLLSTALSLVWTTQAAADGDILPLQGFEGSFPPSGWTREGSFPSCRWAQKKWNSGGLYAPEGTHVAAMTLNGACINTTYQRILWTPRLNFPGDRTYTLSFDFYSPGMSSLEIVASTDGGATYTRVSGLLLGSGDPSSPWRWIDINLSAYAGRPSVTVGFLASMYDNQDLAIDRVQITSGSLPTATPVPPTSTTTPTPTTTPTITPTPLLNPAVWDAPLLAHWKLDEGSGVVASDSSGNAHTLTLYNSASWTSNTPSVSFPNPYAVSLSGGGQFATDSGTLNLANQSFTVALWAKRNRTGVQEIIFSQGTSSSNNQVLQLGFRANDRFMCGFWGNDFESSIVTTDSNWHHYVCAYDASSRARRVYKDGYTNDSDTASANFAGSGPINIGRLAPTLDNYFSGSVDDVRVYGTILTWNQILSLAEGRAVYTPTPTPVALSAYWNFDEQSGSSAADVSGNSHGMTLYGSPAWITAASDTAPVNFTNPSSLNLNGSSQYGTAAGTIDLANKSFTVALWARRSRTYVQEIMLSQGISSGNTQALLMGFNASNYFICGISGYVYSWPVGITDSDWHHYACAYVYLAAYNAITINLYKDGVFLDNHQYFVGYTGSGPVTIGRMAPSADSYFAGAVDDMRIYDRVLSDSELAALAERRPLYTPTPTLTRTPTATATPTLTPVVMSTPVGAGGFLLRESFEGATFPPSGWFVSADGVCTWSRVTAGTNPSQSPFTGIGEARFNSYNCSASGYKRLVLPAQDLNGGNNFELAFRMYHDTWGSSGDRVQV